ncbi:MULTISPECIES: transcriptional regulator [Acetobacter]|uniref:transcriptional regulator n=1 Tax=Acetobacter TaxID=434 RepID=UPI000676B172
MEHNPIKAAVSAAGSKSALAKMLGVTSQAISQWKNIPPAHLEAISSLTKKGFHELRPDLFKRTPAQEATR